MHIISRYNRGGTATWLNILIEEQRKSGNQVVLVSGSVQENEVEDQGFEKLRGIKVANLGKKISFASDLKAIFEIRTIIKTQKPDLINTHTSKAGLVGRIAAYSLLRNRPAIVHTYHGHILYGYYSKFATSIFKSIEKALALITDVFIVSGERVKQELDNAGVFRNKLVFLTRPGIAYSVDDKSLKSDNHPVTVGWLGRLTNIKRPDRVIGLAKEFPDVQFLIGGEGELANSLKTTAPINIQFLGWVNSSEFWQKCDIALLTSDNEAQPISLIEAAAHGLPSIGEDVGSVSDVIQDKITGFLVSGEVERSKALTVLLNDVKQRHDMGATAKNLVSERFGLAQFLSSHDDAYKAALVKRAKVDG